MRLILALLLMFPMVTFGAARTLSDCTNLPAAGSPPTEAAPYDLDNCTINEGDEITGILTGAQSRWGSVALRAPSKTVNATYTGTTVWPVGKSFVLLEDQSALNKFTITHIPGANIFNMWDFTNAGSVKIGGPNLSITFVGTHPGLGQGGAGELQGLIEFLINNGTNPALADIRANFHKTRSQGIVFVGGPGSYQQLNVAGVFLSSGIQVNSGVQNIWLDPDRTVVMDPWNRMQGWDGVIATTVSGVPVGCTDTARQEARNGPRAEFFRFTSLTGGVTSEYGAPIFNLFLPGTIGSSASSRYVVRYKDFGASGPQELTGYPSGVTVKHGVATGLMKHDPANDYDFSGGYKRWIRFQKLPDTYRSGLYGGQITSGCAAGTSSNAFNSGYPFMWKAEASRDGQAGQYITFGFNVEFSGITDHWFWMADTSAYIQASGGGADISPGPSTPDRTYNHTLRAASGARVPGSTDMLDTNTATGPGSWYRLNIRTMPTDQGTTIYPNDNTVTNTRVHGSILVGQNASNTVISNVDLTGDAARQVITVAAGATVTISNVCVRSGSTMIVTSGATVTLDGASVSAGTYTFPAFSGCNITEDGRPSPPGAN